MTGFNAQVDPNAEAARDEAASGSGKFPPLPKGKYQAQIIPLKDGLPFEVVNFSSKPEYAGKKALRIRVQILAGSPLGAKRTYFERIPLFSRYAPSEKNPAGATVKTYWDFWEKCVGASKEQTLQGQLPGWEAIGGKVITITLSDPILPDDYNELGSNEVAFWDKAIGNFDSTPKRIPGQPVAPWLDADDNLLEGFGAVQANTVEAPAGGPAWGVSAADAAAATPAQDGPPAWGTPAAADPALAAAAAAGGAL